jgi:hypothetical protein
MMNQTVLKNNVWLVQEGRAMEFLADKQIPKPQKFA